MTSLTIDQIVSYIVVALTSLSTVIAWIASTIKQITEKKKASEIITQLRDEVKETKSYKEMKAIVGEILEDNRALKEQLNELMTELTRVKKEYRREKASK